MITTDESIALTRDMELLEDLERTLETFRQRADRADTRTTILEAVNTLNSLRRQHRHKVWDYEAATVGTLCELDSTQCVALGHPNPYGMHRM